MNRNRKILCGVYALLALAGLIGTWSHNLAFIAQLEDSGFISGFLAFWPALFANHATSSIALDILVLTTVCSIWMVVEGCRVGVPHAWLFIPFAIFVAIAVSFPLFLIAREVALAKAEADPPTQVEASSDARTPPRHE